MRNREKICAILVTYNRKELLIEALNGLINQTKKLDGIYIIDNASTDKTPELLLEKEFIKKLPPQKLKNPWESENIKSDISIFYLRMDKNSGGAGGFYEGMKRGYEKGFDWLWLMDDDVEPLPNTLETQLKYKNISSCIHPSKKFLNKDNFRWNGYICEKYGVVISLEENFKDKGFTCINYGCFEGMLINRDIVEKIGFPDKEFFIAGDDAFYGYKASKFTNVIYIKDALFLKKIKKDPKNKSSKYLYFVNRNFTYFLMKISKRKYITFFYRLLIAIENSFRYRAFAPLIGFKDGIRGKF